MCRAERRALQGMQIPENIPWVLTLDLQLTSERGREGGREGERGGERERERILRIFHWFLKLATFHQGMG